MKLLNKHTDYAVRALLHLARERDEFISASAIAEKEAIPTQFLKRILQRLIQEKILLSREGVAGGVKLNRDPKEISLVDVMEMFQGEFQLSECMFRRKMCPNRSVCVLRARIKGVEGKILDEFRKVSIGTLVKDLEEKQ